MLSIRNKRKGKPCYVNCNIKYIIGTNKSCIILVTLSDSVVRMCCEFEHVKSTKLV